VRALLLIAALGMCSGVASASDPAEGAGVPGMVSAAAPERPPVLCTAQGCRRAPSAAWTFAAGFGAAALAAARLGRRVRT